MKKEYLAARYRTIRLDNNLTVKAMAAKTGLPAFRISAIELGRRSPSLEDARVVSAAFDDIPINYLLGLDIEEDLPVEVPTFARTITEDDIVQTLKVKCSLDEQEALDFLKTWFDELRACVLTGENVTLAGFGSFYLSKTKGVTFKTNNRLKMMLS